MMNKIFECVVKGGVLCGFAMVSLCASAWGQKGHDTTAYIAEKHLTASTAAMVDSLLDGRSMVYWSNWLDNASYTPEYAYTKTWHYSNVDADETFETRKHASTGDALSGLRYAISVLADKSKGKDDKTLAMKFLVHLIGDLHQPMHMGHASDLGGNLIKVNFFKKENNLHSVWDSSLPESAHKWSYTEWQQQVDRVSEMEEKLIIAGNIDDWARECVAIAAKVYDYFPAGKDISYSDVAYWAPVIEEQFLKGGLRLAHVLNTLFDPSYDATSTTADKF